MNDLRVRLAELREDLEGQLQLLLSGRLYLPLLPASDPAHPDLRSPLPFIVGERKLIALLLDPGDAPTDFPERKVTLQPTELAEACAYAVQNGLSVVIDPLGLHFEIPDDRLPSLAEGRTFTPETGPMTFMPGTRFRRVPLDPPIPDTILLAWRDAAVAEGLDVLYVDMLAIGYGPPRPTLQYQPYPKPHFEYHARTAWERQSIHPQTLLSVPLGSIEGEGYAPPEPPVYRRQRMEGGDVSLFPEGATVSMEAVPTPPKESVIERLVVYALEHGVQRMALFGLRIGVLPPRLAIAIEPFPNDAFAHGLYDFKRQTGWNEPDTPIVQIENVGEAGLREVGMFLME